MVMFTSRDSLVSLSTASCPSAQLQPFPQCHLPRPVPTTQRGVLREWDSLMCQTEP